LSIKFNTVDLQKLHKSFVSYCRALFRKHLFPKIVNIINYLCSGGGPLESLILVEYYVLNANISFTFHAIKNLSAHPPYLCFGAFVNFLVIFFGIFGDNFFFLKGLVKFMEIGNFEDMVLF